MKIILVVFLFIGFSSLNGPAKSVDMGLTSDNLHTKPCPTNHEEADKIIKEYLASEIAIKDLRRQYNMNIDYSAKNKIRGLGEKSDQYECQELIENLNLSKEERLHSFYKTGDNYFIVNYLISENGEFVFKSISIVNKEFEVLGVVLNL